MIVSPSTMRVYMSEYLKALKDLADVKKRVAQNRQVLKDRMLKRYGMGVHVLFAIEGVAAWVYHSCKSGYDSFHAGKEGDVLKVRKLNKRETKYLATKELK